MYQHIEVPKLSTGTESCLLEQMCVHARNTILTQCGREHGFGKLNEAVRATQSHLLNPEDINQLSTNNTLSKIIFLVFDHKGVSVKCIYKFKTKAIRNEMALHKSKVSIPDKTVKSVLKVLINRENTNEQEKLNDKKMSKNCTN